MRGSLIEKVFFNKTNVKLLYCMSDSKERNLKELSHKAKLDQARVSMITRTLAQCKIITRKEEGYSLRIKITNFGLKFIDLFNEFKKLYGEDTFPKPIKQENIKWKKTSSNSTNEKKF